MNKTLFLSSILLLSAFVYAAERRVIVPVNSAKPVGPYSPGIFVGDYLYVSGQGVRDASGQMPAGIAAQTRQCLENVKAVVAAAGLTLAHVVHMQLYLERLSDLPEVERVYAEYFPQQPPARVVLGVTKMPTEITVEMTVVAVRDLKMKQVLNLQSLKPLGHASAAVVAGKRVYLSAVYGKDAAEAERRLQQALREARLNTGRILLRNDYGTAATAALPMNELPEQASAAISVIAARTGAQRSKGAACAAEGQTIFCQAQNAAGGSVLEQVKAVMQKLQTALAQHNANFAHVTATNVYLDDIGEFRPMNEAYATFFSAAPPTRTTVQPFAKSERRQGAAALVRISMVAVKE